MQLVCVSRGGQERGKTFAGSLADKLGFHSLSREELADMATEDGIAVGKLETAVVKKRHLDERLLLEKEHYQAFVVATLCERALEGDLVYHGRAGHLVLQGLPHVLRIRTMVDPETEIEAVTRRLSIGRERAKEYVQRVDEDIARWVRTMYNVPWDPAAGHDLVVNLDRVGVESAATALCGYVQLPEFQSTPASTKALENALLAARVRLALARDERTWAASFTVRSDAGRVTVAYYPKDAAVGARAPDVVERVEGVEDLTCTMAATNILWVQERFAAEGSTFDAVVTAASRWHAAVELLKLTPEGETGASEATTDEADTAPAPPPFTTRARDGGIEDEEEPSTERDAGDDLSRVFEELNARGIAGSARRYPASLRRIGNAIDRTIPYSLVVVGDVFLDQGHASRTRMTRELVGRLGDVVKAPVVNAEDLSRQLKAGASYVAKVLALAASVVLIYLLVFTHQREALAFLSPSTTVGKGVAAAALLVFVPFVAWLYGTLSKSILRLLHVE